MDIDELIRKIIGCAFQVHNTLGPGFLEKVYENSMLIELKSAGLEAEQQLPLTVHTKDNRWVNILWIFGWISGSLLSSRLCRN